MARREVVKRKVKAAKRKVTRKLAKAKRTVKRAVRKVARKRAVVRAVVRRTAGKKAAAPPRVRPGTITHTELASANPTATREWCASVLGWKFGDAMPTPSGPYHMWRFDNGTGGGLRANNPPEVPGSIPYCEVRDIQSTYAKALQAGASEMMAPEALPGGMGWIAIVAAPGGVAIGFWSMK